MANRSCVTCAVLLLATAVEPAHAQPGGTVVLGPAYLAGVSDFKLSDHGIGGELGTRPFEAPPQADLVASTPLPGRDPYAVTPGWLRPASKPARVAQADGPHEADGPPEADGPVSPRSSQIGDDMGPVVQSRSEVPRQGWTKDLTRLEIGFQVFNALDAATTLRCLDLPNCHEGNPLYGRNPSAGTVIGVKGGMGLLHFLALRSIAQSNTGVARMFGWLTTAVQGGVVGFNMTQVF